MAEVRKTINYLRNSLELGRLASVEFSQKEKHHNQPYEIVRDGVLPPETVGELLIEHEEKNPRAYREGRPVPLIISLRTLMGVNSAKVVHGLLLASASMDQNGTLAYDPQSHYAWIPLDRLHMDGGEDLDVMVGNLSAFRRFQVKDGESLRSKIDSWQEYINYAETMYDKVLDKQSAGKALRECDCAIEAEICCLKYYDDFDATALIIALYDQLLIEKKTPELFTAMVELDAVRQVDDSDIEADQVQNMLDACGHVSSTFSLAPSQRRAVHGFNQLGRGKVLAVSGPPGTGKTTTLQDMVANLVTEHALKNEPAPLIVGMSTNNQAVTNIIDSFGNIVSSDPQSLDYRWIPRINVEYDRKGREVSHSIEGSVAGLATYCPSNGKILEAKQKGYLFEFANRSGEGVYSRYSSKEYQDEAIPFFLSSASRFLQHDISDLETAKRSLSERLSEVDRARRSLIGCFSKMISVGADGQGIREKIEEKCNEQKSLEALYGKLQQRLGFWDDLKRKHALKVLFRLNHENIIIAHQDIDESIVSGCKSFDEVCDAYKREIRRAGESEVRVCHALASLKALEREQGERRKTCLRLVGQLVKACGLDSGQAERLLSMLEPNNEGLAELDKVLDVTVRMAEFWIAIHVYECDWLLACQNDEIIKEEDRFKSTREVLGKYWDQAPCLTPCFVMTAYMLPRMFKRYSKDGCPKFDLERIDLLIVDEAGQVDVPIGLASFGIAKKAVVVGDTKQLDPIWAFDEISDKDVASINSCDEAYWTMLKDGGSTASPPSSIMKLATAITPWRYSKEEGGVFLSEHYRCSPEIIGYCNKLLYGGRLEPQRPPAAVDERNPMGKDFWPISYRLVSGSRSVSYGSSRRNMQEARDIADWVSENFSMIECRYSDKSADELVGVVTPFSAQAKLIKRVLSETCPDLAKLVTVGTAHKLQGAERPVVLFSAVYGDNDDRAGFIENNPKLMNVAVSRAKDLFVVFCSEKRTGDGGKVLATLFRCAREGTPDADSSAKGSLLDERDLTEQTSYEGESPVILEKGVSASTFSDGSLDKSVSALLVEWSSDGAFAGRKKPNASQANTILAELGLIDKLDAGEWRPTGDGENMGIVSACTNGGKRYCRYTMRAKTVILPIFLQELDGADR